MVALHLQVSFPYGSSATKVIPRDGVLCSAVLRLEFIFCNVLSHQNIGIAKDAQNGAPGALSIANWLACVHAVLN